MNSILELFNPALGFSTQSLWLIFRIRDSSGSMCKWIRVLWAAASPQWICCCSVIKSAKRAIWGVQTSSVWAFGKVDSQHDTSVGWSQVWVLHVDFHDICPCWGWAIWAIRGLQRVLVLRCPKLYLEHFLSVVGYNHSWVCMRDLMTWEVIHLKL